MTEIHPAFDVETRTWFVQHPKRKSGYIEAPSIRQLLDKLGDDFTAIGYTTERVPHPSEPARGHVPYGEAASLTRPPSPALHKAISGRMYSKPPPTPVDATPIAAKKASTEAQRAKWRADCRKRYRKRRPPVEIPKPVRDALSAERAKWTPLENMVLDAWAAGLSGPLIASSARDLFPDSRAKITPAYVGAHLMKRARDRGDPRAVVRNPLKYGKKVHGYGGLG